MPANLLREFDELIRARGYKNRSKAISDALVHYISEYRWEMAEKEVVGVISLVYDRETRGVSDALTELEHSYSRNIISTLHVHITEDRCLEVIVARGYASDINRLAGRLMSQRGVVQLKLLTT